MAFAASVPAVYGAAMNATRPRFLPLALAAALLAAVTGAAFAAWVEHGAGIFLAMAASGMSWCF